MSKSLHTHIAAQAKQEGAAACFIGTEKTKGTLRLLRILPISPGRIALTKALAALSLTLVSINCCLIFEPLAIHRLTGLAFDPPPNLIAGVNLGAIVYISFLVAVFAVFEMKVAAQVGYISLLVVATAAPALEKRAAALGLWNHAPVWVALGLEVLAVSAVFVLFSCKHFAAMDRGSARDTALRR